MTDPEQYANHYIIYCTSRMVSFWITLKFNGNGVDFELYGELCMNETGKICDIYIPVVKKTNKLRFFRQGIARQPGYRIVPCLIRSPPC